MYNIFNNYALLPGAQADKAWYDSAMLEDKYFIIRFEFDNINAEQLVLHQTNIQALKSDR